MRAIILLLSTLLFSIALASNGLTDRVSWDKYSLKVDGKRVYIFSGEFHYQRLPVPELWLDVFQKFKANGLNAISIYFFWSYHSSKKGHFDLKTGARDIQRMLDMAKEAGLYVISRPGPYCNAETNAGGIALWTTDGSAGKYRTSDERFHQAWLPWVREVGKILAKNQITNGGPVILHQIENELEESVHQANHTLVTYMKQIEKAFRDAGMVVPFTHNEKGMRAQSWSTDYQNVGGAVEVYGLDSYPGGLSCTDPEKGFKVVREYHRWFQNYSFTQPGFMPEFQAGWFRPWGGEFYDQCASDHDPAFPDVYYKNNVGQRVTLLNLYMAYGGTNWGQSAAPVVYTSYDYTAPLRETRQVQDKFKQSKLLSLFLRVSTDILKTNMVGFGAGRAVDNRKIWIWEQKNPDTGAGFYIVQQNDTRSRSTQRFSMSLSTSLGVANIPNVVLDGRQSKIAVTDYKIGNTTVLYSSVDILIYGVFDVPVLVFYLKEGQNGEFALKATEEGMEFKTYGVASNFKAGSGKTDSGRSFPKYTWTQPKGGSVIKFSDGLLVYLLDVPTAWSFFAPATTLNPNVKPDEQIFVIGPYLVRNASVSNSVVHIIGDNSLETSIEIYAGDSKVGKATWNGQDLTVMRTKYGSLTSKISGAEGKQINLPELLDWKFADSLPEIQQDYNDSEWTVCNKKSTQSPIKPATLPVLYSSDYGFHSGIKIYRGRFEGDSAVRANITVQGGSAAGWSAWLNGKFVGGSPGNPSKLATSNMLNFTKVPLSETTNLLTVVTDYTGHDQTSVRPAGPANPRGILAARLYGKDNAELKFNQWKIQGNAGGESEIDVVRGPMNEGGLYGERLGWHLPGFDASSWKRGSPTQAMNGAGINWYLTTFPLNLDVDMDVPLGIELSAPSGTVARVQMFINGYQYGKYLPHIGPQTRFPIPPGIINTRGVNTLALSLWAQSEHGARLSEVKLIKYGAYQTGFNFSLDWSYLQPGWTKERIQYAHKQA